MRTPQQVAEEELPFVDCQYIYKTQYHEEDVRDKMKDAVRSRDKEIAKELRLTLSTYKSRPTTGKRLNYVRIEIKKIIKFLEGKE